VPETGFPHCQQNVSFDARRAPQKMQNVESILFAGGGRNAWAAEASPVARVAA